MAMMAPGLGERAVRVIGVRRNRFVEFEFSLRDQDLSLQLVLPYPEFVEFCAEQGAAILPPTPGVTSALGRLQRSVKPIGKPR